MAIVSAESIAPVNIAVIKYWGKRDEQLILPVNSSLSVTLNIESLCSRTRVSAVLGASDSMFLNGFVSIGFIIIY